MQHHRRRCLDQNDLEPHRRTDDAIDISRPDPALDKRTALDVVLHVCCTPADSIKIGGHYELLQALTTTENPEVSALRFKITNGVEPYTSSSVVTRGTK